MRAQPDQVQLALNVIAARCAMGALASDDIERARIALRTARDPGTLLVSWFGRAVDDSNGTPCEGLDLETLTSLAEAGAANPWYPEGRRQDLDHIAGEIALRRDDAVGALAAFDRALARDPRPGMALAQAAALGSAGYPAEGLRHLATFDTLSVAHKAPSGMPAIHAWVLARQHYWTRERMRLESALQQDLEKEDRHP